jgi:hypothetical protein
VTVNLRKLARGQECQARLPNVCNFNSETVVLAHVRDGGVAGMGIKPPDICGLWACSSCHDEIDRRTRKIETKELKPMVLDGLNRTLAILSRIGVI